MQPLSSLSLAHSGHQARPFLPFSATFQAQQGLKGQELLLLFITDKNRA